jgi:16S rRNA (cytosine1402-N4)-methyltransferase
MMAGGDGFNAVAGGPGPHIPVLGRAAAEYLNLGHEGRNDPGHEGRTIDATFGAGGYTREILKAGGRVLAIDRDHTAILLGADLVESAKGRLELVEANFSEIEDVAGGEPVDGIVFDLGVSSMQLDRAERGFSFRHDGPLDMRMGRGGPTAADLVNGVSERDLANIIFKLGDERHSRAVARAIVKARAQAAITTTKQLADIVASVVRSKPGDIHPATRTFQALRIFINEELLELTQALSAAEHILRPQGRLVVVSFHSLEDRIVKTFINDRSRSGGGSRHRPEAQAPAPSFVAVTGRPVVADAEEVARNPRARSAKLRAAERTAAPARAGDPASLLPTLPSLAEVMRG